MPEQIRKFWLHSYCLACWAEEICRRHFEILFLLFVQTKFTVYIKSRIKSIKVAIGNVEHSRERNLDLLQTILHAISYCIFWKKNIIKSFAEFAERKLNVTLYCKVVSDTHYEKKKPIQIYWKFYHPKKWKFSDKKFWYFSYFCSKHRLWVLVRTASARRF